MKNTIYLMLAIFTLAAAQLSAQEKPDHRNGERNQIRRHNRISLPVYAAKPDHNQPQQAVTPEQRAKFEAARKRRFEIMVLIGAYKIMPEAQRAALKAELLKRIQDDFNASMQMRKARIAQAEEELKQLRADLAEKEAKADKLVAEEMERLLKNPMPGPRRAPHQNHAPNRAK